MNAFRPPLNPTQRFSDRVDDYVRYRPSYPAALMGRLAVLGRLEVGRVVADVGSGTGILTRLLLAKGARVIGIEPNSAMRAAAERAFSGEARFESKDTRAEATGLADASVDMITAAQSFHWFDPVAARAEFARILKPGRPVALIWNQRFDTPLNRDYVAMLERFAPEYQPLRERDRVAEARVRPFFAPQAVELEAFAFEQRLDEAGLRGRLASESCTPRAGHPLYEPMMAELTSIFRRYAENGEVVLQYETILWHGSLACDSR
ncbi:MAG TPA: class I SAM-dependent methyltransferase [Polyangiaceae bacterium]|nr:class I SAM-dependent methyltransferase [Polyangiaceae bacterium]